LEVVSGTWLMQTNIFIIYVFMYFSERKSINFFSTFCMHA
jgi:hypothetical protein